MTRKVIKIGSSEGVTIPKEVTKKLNLKPGDEVEVEFDKDRKTFSYKVSDEDKEKKERREHIAKLTTNFIERYREDLEALADK